jgi:hypothetical protein
MILKLQIQNLSGLDNPAETESLLHLGHLKPSQAIPMAMPSTNLLHSQKGLQ